MSLLVFVDEHGTMPISEREEPFLVSAVAVPGSFAVGKRTPGAHVVANVLLGLGAWVHVAYLKPSDGFSEKYESRRKKIDAMAHSRRMLDGANRRYWKPSEGPRRNSVWGTCAGLALQQAVVMAVLSDVAVDSVHFHAHQKSMCDEDRNHFEKICKLTMQRLEETLQRLPATVRTNAILVRVRRCLATPVVTWGSLEAGDEMAYGLWLADRVADYSGRDLRANRNPTEWLSGLGVQVSATNAEEHLTRQPHDSVVERWKKDTGLPEPG